MSIRLDVKRTKFFNELSLDNQLKFFDFSVKKIIPHVDTFYYTVSLEGDITGSIYSGIIEMIDFLSSCKSEVDDRKEDMWLYYDEKIVLKNRSFKLYNYCISRENYFDIFIAKSLPNDNTPRVFVQLRSVGLWELGEYELIKESFRCLNILLNEFNISVDKVFENRIDFCYHTNLIQNPNKFFGDDCLINNLKTTFTLGSKVFSIKPKELTVDYLSLGRRKSNNLFFRSYNKVKEVVSQNYKGFFIEFWFNSKLINYYDYFVYTYAYDKGNYSYIWEGIAQFYIKYGNDNYIKSCLLKMINDCNVTVDVLKSYLVKFMPLPTQIINIEFQTMRKFYYSYDKIDFLPIQTDLNDFNLLRLFRLLDNRKLFLDYLTGTTVKFVKDNSLKDSPCLDFWRRIQNVKLFKNINGSFERIYPVSRVDEVKTINKLKKQLARLSLIKQNYDTGINEDMSILFGVLNDNDINVDSDGILSIIDGKYNKIKDREKKKILSIVKKDEKKENV